MEYLKQIGVIGVLSLSLIAVQASGFTEPTLPPPDGNVSAPINTGGVAQGKLGALVVNQHVNEDSGLGFLVHKGIAGFGSYPSTTERVNIKGKIKIADGSQGENKVLVSDAGGLGTWKNIPEIYNKCRDPLDVGQLPYNAECTEFPDGAMLMWGKLSANEFDRTRLSGGKWRRSVSMRSSYRGIHDYVVNINPAGGGSASENCVPGIVFPMRVNGFDFITDDTCDGVIFFWQTIGR